MIDIRYRNKPAVIIATGPSLTDETVEIISKYKNSHVFFGCNDAYRKVNFLNEHYALDHAWWDYHGNSVKDIYKGVSWCGWQDICAELNLQYIRGKDKEGLSLDSRYIHWGDNSGFQVLNLAVLMGCSAFIMVGFNMGVKEGEKKHFFGDHPEQCLQQSPWDSFKKSFQYVADVQPELAARIVNCTPNTALECFRIGDLETEMIKTA